MSKQASLIHGKNVLITRPLHQSFHLKKLLEAENAHVIVFPTICIKAIQDPSKLKALCASLATFDFAIFLSANAVEACTPYWPKSSLNVKVIAIGTGTAKELMASGIQVEAIPKHFSSEGLLDMPGLQFISNKRIIVFCGENPRPLLFEKLRERGATVETAICYRRDMPHYSEDQVKSIMEKSIDWIISASLDGLKNLITIFSNHLDDIREIPIVVVNESMRVHCEEVGWRARIFCSKDASDNAILGKIRVQ